MAIELQETFTVSAPISRVWDFMMTPENVAKCMPGANLTQLIDDRKFEGNIKVKLGAITARYEGTITYTTADEATRCVVMLAQAKEKGGGTVSGTITTSLVALSPTETEVRCESSVDMTGRIVQVGRGMIEGVADQIIGKFVKNVKTLLEVPEAAPAATGTAGEGAPSPVEPAVAKAAEAARIAAAEKQLDNEAVNLFGMIWKVIRDWLAGLFKGRQSTAKK